MDFNIERWEKACDKFQKNRNKAGYFVCCYLKENGHLGRNILIPEPYEKYRDNIKKLNDIVIDGGLKLVEGFLNPNLFCYGEEDAKQILAKLKQYMNEYLYDVILGSLFQYSNDEFVGVVNQFDNIFRLRYQLSVLKLEKKQFVLPDGSVWVGNGWLQDGILKQNGSQIWDLLLGQFSNNNHLEYQFQLLDTKAKLKKIGFMLKEIRFDKTISRFRLQDLTWNGENWISENNVPVLENLRDIWQAILGDLVVDIRIPGHWKGEIPELQYQRKTA